MKSYTITDANETFLANMLRPADGKPARHIITGRRHRPVGLYASVKNRNGMPYESRLELYGFYHAEVSPDVLSYTAQPHTLKLIVNGKSLRYTPDRMDIMVDGCRQIIEIKDKFKPEKIPDYTQKLQQAAHVYQKIGWQFCIVERQELMAEPLFSAIMEIQAFRNTLVTEADAYRVTCLFNHADIWTLGDVKEIFGNRMLGMAKVYAMVVRRMLALDLESGLNDETPVRLSNAMGGT